MDSIIIPYNLKINNAQEFINDLSNNSYYIGLGRVHQWTPTTESPSANDTNPPTIISSYSALSEVWNNSFGLKRINSNNASLAIPRYNWTTGTVYEQYDSYDTELYNKNFYVLTSANEVFKCISNNNGAQSTVEPTQSAPNTGDGYMWRYMYTLSTSEILNFLTTDFIPVSEYSASPIPGEILSCKVTNSGSGYTTATVTITGDGTGATANATISGGQITKIDIITEGTNYSIANIQITGDGTGATAYANIAPPGGHGSNAAFELFANYVVISESISYDEGGTFLIGNDFRQVFLVKNPLAYGATTVTTTSLANMTTRVELTDVSSFTLDQSVTIRNGSTDLGTAIVAYIDGVNNILHLTNITSPTLTTTYVIFDGVSSHTINGVVPPDVQPNTGKIIFVLNKQPTTRNNLQTETFKIPFKW